MFVTIEVVQRCVHAGCPAVQTEGQRAVSMEPDIKSECSEVCKYILRLLSVNKTCGTIHTNTVFYIV